MWREREREREVEIEMKTVRLNVNVNVNPLVKSIMCRVYLLRPNEQIAERSKILAEPRERNEKKKLITTTTAADTTHRA